MNSTDLATRLTLIAVIPANAERVNCMRHPHHVLDMIAAPKNRRLTRLGKVDDQPATLVKLSLMSLRSRGLICQCSGGRNLNHQLANVELLLVERRSQSIGRLQTIGADRLFDQVMKQLVDEG